MKAKSLWLAMVVGGVLVITPVKQPLAESCASVTGYYNVDQACCVEPGSNTYVDFYGESTHEAYLSCVGSVAVDFSLSNELSDIDMEAAIEKAAQSSVNR